MARGRLSRNKKRHYMGIYRRLHVWIAPQEGNVVIDVLGRTQRVRLANHVSGH